ncbi:5-keto-L-gluconate epimerase [Pseudothermotoga thermarum]|uniref:Xylose isomerase domain-containing protein TIM barrel n=1 Tax=Pseudothermotoga thermarum DSM 5069 TaxID=688269 RepID=F7YTG2_9THEM|nr:5-keto-L-gluconate epimerase [Pseudothermotoga thermarum]AEH51176.1 Xylose isomerase domain-containing protein TIM barrel [Pseudothermotoga thermarum DSM 5069]
MKLSLVISTTDAAFNSLAFKGDLVKGIELAKKIGYDGVEIAIRDPKLADVNLIKKVVLDFKIQVVAIGTGQAYLAEGLNLIDEDENIRKKAFERLIDHINFASIFGAKVIIGFIRGKKKNRDEKQVQKLFIEQIAKLADYAQLLSVQLVIEPLNRYEIDFLNTLDETYELVKVLNHDSVGILADTFHMNIEEPRIEESLEKVKDKLYHFHVADSNRWAPGAGHIDFGSIIRTLRKIGYNSFLSVECLPLPGGAEKAARLAYETLKNIILDFEKISKTLEQT